MSTAAASRLTRAPRVTDTPRAHHRLYPKLLPHAEKLEVGLAPPVAAVEEEDAAAEELPEPELVQRTEPAAEKSAGFGPLVDPYAGHYFMESDQMGNEGKKMLADSRGLAATKAATAMSFSKSLGLRSG